MTAALLIERRRLSSRSTAVIDRRYNLAFLFFELRLNRGLDLLVERRVALQCFFCGITTLRELRAFIVQPRPAFLDDLFLERQIEQRPRRRNSLVIHDVELRFSERRRDLVLYHF